jgi:uncharacterized protein YjiS (DUF1127 family)
MISNSGTHSLFEGAVFGSATTRDPVVSAGILKRTGLWLLTCNERRRQRYTLAGLSDRLLADLGLSRSDVSREIEKWPWQN